MNNADFTRGKIVLPLVRFVFPILFAMLIQSLYGAADLLVVGRFSDAAGVSAVSVGSQVMMSVTMVVAQLSAGSAILLGQAVSSFVAQNYGAGRMDRAEKALRYGIGISFACSLVLGYAAFFHGAALSSLFSKAPAICHASAAYLKAYGIDCLLTSFLFCLIGFLSGCSRTRFVMLQGIAGAFGVRVPLSLLFSRVQPVSLFRIGLATPCSSAVQILLCLVCLLHIRRQLAAQASNP